MLAVCQKVPTHDRFITVAHVAEDWVVDSSGDWVEELSGSPKETTHAPDSGNEWSCHICDGEVIVFDVDGKYKIGICPACRRYGPEGHTCPSCVGHWFTNNHLVLGMDEDDLSNNPITMEKVMDKLKAPARRPEELVLMHNAVCPIKIEHMYGKLYRYCHPKKCPIFQVGEGSS